MAIKPARRTVGMNSQRPHTDKKTGKTTKKPSARLMERRAKDTIPGYYPNPAPSRQFCKVIFYGARGKTAGIVLPTDKVIGATAAKLSRYFPVSEAMKMEKIYVSDAFDTWEEAFHFQPEID